MAGGIVPRGSLLLVALPGDYGKPRPALVVQSSDLGLPSVVVCPLTTTVRRDLPAFRHTIEPSAMNNLRVLSQVMIDKPVTIPLTKVRETIGSIGDDALEAVTRGLALLLGFA